MGFRVKKMNQRLIVSIVLTLFVSFQYEVAARPPLRIVNGTAAEEGEFPYTVELRRNVGIFTCGGSIIGPEWILTAAHCLDSYVIETVVYGTTELYDFYDGDPDTSVRVKRKFHHPNYSINSLGVPVYDIALLQLETPIPLSAIAQIVKLPEANAAIPIHVDGDLSGWGANETTGNLMKHLQKINLPLLSDDECTQKINDYSGNNSFVPIHNICSDDYYNGECYGDSGGPYVINGTQYGIVSWSYKPCGIVPGAYTRISNPEYRNWITEITNI